MWTSSTGQEKWHLEDGWNLPRVPSLTLFTNWLWQNLWSNKPEILYLNCNPFQKESCYAQRKMYSVTVEESQPCVITPHLEMCKNSYKFYDIKFTANSFVYRQVRSKSFEFPWPAWERTYENYSLTDPTNDRRSMCSRWGSNKWAWYLRIIDDSIISNMGWIMRSQVNRNSSGLCTVFHRNKLQTWRRTFFEWFGEDGAWNTGQIILRMSLNCNVFKNEFE